MGGHGETKRDRHRGWGDRRHLRLLPETRRVGGDPRRASRDLRWLLVWQCRDAGAEPPPPLGGARGVVAGPQVDARAREPLLHQAPPGPRALFLALAVS